MAQALSQSGANLMYYKVVQVLLQSGVAFRIKKRGKLYYKVGQLLKHGVGITKWDDFYYKFWQLLQSMVVHMINELLKTKMSLSKITEIFVSGNFQNKFKRDEMTNEICTGSVHGYNRDKNRQHLQIQIL